MIVSFAWTTPALLSGAKTCTRRTWQGDYARRFEAGDIVHAYNRSPRAQGLEVARVRLTAAPALEPMALMPDDDYVAEGFEWLSQHPEALPKSLDDAPFTRADVGGEAFQRWRRSGGSMWVVRFELVSYHGPNIRAVVRPEVREAISHSLPMGLWERWTAAMIAALVPA